MVFAQTDGIVFVPLDHTCKRGPSVARMLDLKKKKPLQVGQRGGASLWRVCYQQGLPRLVF